MHSQISAYFDSVLSKYQSGFRQQCLLLPIEKWEKKVRQRWYMWGITDLSKAFECLLHDSLIAKLHAQIMCRIKLLNLDSTHNDSQLSRR